MTTVPLAVVTFGQVPGSTPGYQNFLVHVGTRYVTDFGKQDDADAFAARLNAEAPAKAEAEHAGRMQWYGICSDQGWNADSQILHLQGFIAERGLLADFAAYTAEVAAEENAEAAKMASEGDDARSYGPAGAPPESDEGDDEDTPETDPAKMDAETLDKEIGFADVCRGDSDEADLWADRLVAERARRLGKSAQ